MKTDEEPKIGLTEEECARACAQSKRCSCDSFSYNAEKRRCLLGNRFSNVPFDSLLQRKAWNYYSFNGSLNNNCRLPRPAHTQIEGLKLINGGDESTVDIVHVKINGTWGGICDDGFGFNEANVICRQLGYYMGAKNVTRGQGTNPDDLISLHDMTCKGDEKHISECDFEDHSAHNHACVGTEKAGLKCRKAEKKCDEGHQFHCKNKECIEVNDLCNGEAQCGDGSDEDPVICKRPLQIRLVGGPSQNGRVGRVEIRHKGVWGTVCQENFGTQEAEVVCRMLGFPSNNAKRYEGTTDYQGDGPVWIRLTDDKTCLGNETNINQCKEQHLWTHDYYCNHIEDVAVSCEDTSPILYTPPTTQIEPMDLDDINSNRQTFDNEMLSNEATHSLEGTSVDCGKIRLDYPRQSLDGGRFGTTPEPEELDFLPRIRDGTDSYCGEHPWQASIRVRGYEQNYHWCGASIISRSHLITAAHCLKDFPQSTYLIRVGDCNLEFPDSEETEYDIEEINFHENFNVGPYLNNDIAIVKIQSNDSSGMAFGRYVSPVCLPLPNLNYNGLSNLTITGWGKIGYDSDVVSNRENLPKQNKQGAVITLQKADVPILSTNQCTSSEVCLFFFKV